MNITYFQQTPFQLQDNLYATLSLLLLKIATANLLIQESYNFIAFGKPSYVNKV